MGRWEVWKLREAGPGTLSSMNGRSDHQPKTLEDTPKTTTTSLILGGGRVSAGPGKEIVAPTSRRRVFGKLKGD